MGSKVVDDKDKMPIMPVQRRVQKPVNVNKHQHEPIQDEKLRVLEGRKNLIEELVSDP